MAQTFYTDLNSENVLSAHISGLQHSINKLEETLNMKTASTTNHVLNPVADQDDLTLRYRIYEGTIRNWLDSPSPVIKRNGSTVSSSEYEISPGHGVVVFDVQQDSNDQITFDGSYLSGGSIELEGLDHAAAYHPSGKLKTSNKREVSAEATGVLIAATQPDIFPFVVTKTSTYSGMAVKVDGTAGTGARLAVYEDDGAGYPGNLIHDAGTVDTTTTGWKETTTSFTLEPGVYWLVRNTDGGSSFGGFDQASMQHVPFYDVEGSYTYNGSATEGSLPAYRHPNLSYAAYPATFPSGAELLDRSAYACVFLRKA